MQRLVWVGIAGLLLALVGSACTSDSEPSSTESDPGAPAATPPTTAPGSFSSAGLDLLNPDRDQTPAESKMADIVTRILTADDLPPARWEDPEIAVVSPEDLVGPDVEAIQDGIASVFDACDLGDFAPPPPLLIGSSVFMASQGAGVTTVQLIVSRYQDADDATVSMGPAAEDPQVLAACMSDTLAETTLAQLGPVGAQLNLDVAVTGRRIETNDPTFFGSDQEVAMTMSARDRADMPPIDMRMRFTQFAWQESDIIAMFLVNHVDSIAVEVDALQLASLVRERLSEALQQ